MNRMVIGALMCAACVGSASAQLFRYDSRSQFNADNPMAAVEDFEDADAPPGALVFSSIVIDSSTGDAVFDPGDIVEGVRFTGVPGQAVCVAGSGVFGFPSKTLYTCITSHPVPDVAIEFTDGTATGVCFDINGFAGLMIEIEVFSGATSLGVHQIEIDQAVFFYGVRSKGPPITRVTVDSGASFDPFGVDNVAFTGAGLLTSRAEFDAMFPGARFEDFEEARVDPGNFENTADVVDEFTDDGVFAPGEIVPGLRITDAGGSDLTIGADGADTYISDVMTHVQNVAGPELIVEFPVGTSGFGMDVVGAPDFAPGDIRIYAGDMLLTELTGAAFPGGVGAFLGYHSSGPPITRVEIDSTSTGTDGFMGVDNIALATYRTVLSSAAFDARYPDAILEDFEEAMLAPGDWDGTTNPLDSSTDDDIFSPGDIADGLTIRGIVGGLIVVTPGSVFDPPSVAVFSGAINTFSNEFGIEFNTLDVRAVGFDVLLNFSGSTVEMEVYSGDILLGSRVVTGTSAGTFVGFESASGPITRIEFNDPSFSDVGVDNIRFVAVPTQCNAADIDCDGDNDPDDIELFVDAFIAMQPAADIEDDGDVDVDDIEAFVVVFLGGCP